MAEPRIRADAARNRRAIVETARAVWSDDREATMHSVARRAGIGQGTLYRHFPTREALIIAVYADEFDGLIDRASALLAREVPVRALRLWLDELAVFGRSKHALGDALDTVVASPMHVEQLDRITAAIDSLLEAGRAAGAIRADADADDLLSLASFLWHLESGGGAGAPHLLDLVVDALRVRDPA